MSVTVRVGDLFESRAQTLVNTVNTVGVMGKGVALEFRRRFPDMFEDYVERCRRREVRLGRPYLFRSNKRWIVNFPTKDHWRSMSRLSDIVAGLDYLLEHYHEWGIRSMAVPPLGAGQGQLEWPVVGPTLFRALGRMEIPVELYAPFGTPHEELEPVYLDRTLFDLHGFTPERIGPEWVAFVAILARIVHEPYHWPVGRTTLQKIAYFATVAGLPTGLTFEKASFGPFSKDLKRQLTRLEFNQLVTEERVGRMFSVKPGPTYRDARRAYEERMEPWRPIVHRVADLFLRIRTTDQAELAATVHFAAASLRRATPAPVAEHDVMNYVLNWKPRLDRELVANTIRQLALLGWIDVEAGEIPADELAVVGV